MSTSSRYVTSTVASPERRSQLGYRLMLGFSFLYFLRPEDFIPGLSALHLARITAAAAVLALLLSTNKRLQGGIPFEVKIIVAMFGWMSLTIPFAYWRTGSLELVFVEFSKVVIVALALTFTVKRVEELRRLMFVQAFAMALLTTVSVFAHNAVQGRLGGVNHALLENPNGLAMNVALNWPLCLVFLLTSRGLLRKSFWAVSMLVMIYAVLATYSRAGFLALAVAAGLCVWDFGVRGRRLYMLVGAAFCLFVCMLVVPKDYGKRLETLVGTFQEGDLDRGSTEARQDLLRLSLKVTAAHPIFGVGPGNFSPYTGFWHVTHNTYTQFSSECGVPGLLLFLILIWGAFRNLRYVQNRSPSSGTNDLTLYASALKAALASYILAGFFCSSAYDLFPYYLVLYTTLLYRLAHGVETVAPQIIVKASNTTRKRTYALRDV